MSGQALQIADREIEEIQNLLNEHGATLKYMHPGILREYSADGSSRYVTDVFGCFSSAKSKSLAMDLNYLDAVDRVIQSLPSNIMNDSIKAQAGLAVASAIRDCKIYRPHITYPATQPHVTR